MKNKIIADHGGWLEVDVSTNMYPNSTMKIDTDDWNYISSAFRATVSTSRHGYAGFYKNRLTHLLVHRVLIPCDGVIDHINGDGLDNRRKNIRPCSVQENSRNRHGQANNTSGFVGVCWNCASKKWYARICVSGKNINLGLFSDIEDAICARIKAEKKIFGEFAPQR